MNNQDMPTNLPSFLVIGTQKGATSWLYYRLKEHPQIYLPPKKREVNFLGGEKYFKMGLQWWISRFSGADTKQIVGDVSVDYMLSKTAPELIRKYLGDVKIIVSLRNPISRSISAYYWNLRQGKIPNLDLNKGLRAAIKQGGINCTAEVKSIYKNIIKRGFYDEQINKFLKYHNLDQFFFLSFEKIKDSPKRELKRIYEFLEVDGCFTPRLPKYKPKQNSYISYMISLERVCEKNRLLKKFFDLTNSLICYIGLGGEVPRIETDVLEQLQEIFLPHNQKLKHILNKHQGIVPSRLTGNIDWSEEIDKWKNATS